MLVSKVLPRSVEDLFSFERHEIASMNHSLGPIRLVLEELGDPQCTFDAVLVGGTNGKGSTSTFIYSVLLEAGYSVGLYTSPHLLDVRERIMLRGYLVSRKELDQAFMEVLRAVLKAGTVLSFFEWITAMMFFVFSKAKLDIAVLEVGMGGRLDATNLCKKKATVITSVGKDHSLYLGNTLKSVLKEKAGILKPDTPLFANIKLQSLKIELISIARSIGSYAYFLGESFFVTETESSLNGSTFNYHGPKWKTSIRINMPGIHQVENASLAIACLEYLGEHCGFDIDLKTLAGGLSKAHVKARLQVIHRDPLWVLDGAHNVEGVISLLFFIKESLGGVLPVWVVSISKGKDIRSILKCMQSMSSAFIFPSVNHERLVSANDLSNVANNLSIRYMVVPSLYDALTLLDAKKPVVFAGSLFFAAEVLKHYAYIHEE